MDGHLLAVHGYEYDTYVGEYESSTFWARIWMLYESVFKTWVRLPEEHYTSNRVAHYLFFHVARPAGCVHWVPASGGRTSGAAWRTPSRSGRGAASGIPWG